MKVISRVIIKLVIAFNRTVAADEAASGPDESRSRREVPQLRLQKVEDGIATVEITGSQYLAERMGSSGSQNDLAAATFTLSECPPGAVRVLRLPRRRSCGPGGLHEGTLCRCPDRGGWVAASRRLHGNDYL